MPYRNALASTRYLPRFWVDWPVFDWQQVLAGLPYVPTPILISCVSVLPLYTLLVVLLDSALAVPNVLVGGLITIMLTVCMWFINRNQTASDAASKRAEDSNKKTEEAVHALTALVMEMRIERKEDRLLTTYLKERQDKLEHENASLRHSVQAFDTFIAVQVAAKNNAAK